MYEETNTNRNPFTSAANNALWSLQGRNTSTTPAVGYSSPATIPQNLFANPAIQPSSVINLSNSRDVVIGPMTQYQGPVTIYQHMDATVEARSMQANGGINQSRNTTNTSFMQTLTTTSKLLIVLLMTVIVVAGVFIYVILNKKNAISKNLILFGNDSEHGTFLNLGNGHFIVDRDQWGASNTVRNLTIPLEHPIPYVVITHIGVQAEPCLTLYQCSIVMRTIQDSAIAEKNIPDINSNFYVGDDGNVYMGRGWNWANTYANHSLAITLMGDYGRYVPTNKQLEATQFLLAHALAENYLRPDYNLVAHNQTKNTKSPGANVYREIKKWPRFYNCGGKDGPKCGAELGMSAIWDANQ